MAGMMAATVVVVIDNVDFNFRAATDSAVTAPLVLLQERTFNVGKDGAATGGGGRGSGWDLQRCTRAAVVGDGLLAFTVKVHVCFPLVAAGLFLAKFDGDFALACDDAEAFLVETTHLQGTCGQILRVDSFSGGAVVQGELEVGDNAGLDNVTDAGVRQFYGGANEEGTIGDDSSVVAIKIFVLVEEFGVSLVRKASKPSQMAELEMTMGVVVISSSVDESEEEREGDGEGVREGGSGVFSGTLSGGGDGVKEQECLWLAMAVAARVCSGVAVEGVREDGRVATWQRISAGSAEAINDISHKQNKTRNGIANAKQYKGNEIQNL
ncbi:hypothetical protein DFH09DRAFT_1078767 [Mycena vulgaris]|nr:hypothetical protein DFH09DRAFT_1078767 [Mycena vulgaris]